MNDFRSPRRKIDPTRGETLGDGTPNDNDRLEIGPTLLAFREWEEAGLKLPDLAAMRRYRLDRLVEHIVRRQYGGLLLTDPLNIRYATDTTNMQLWNAHNPFRAVLVCADGYMVIWDFKNSPFLADYNPLVRESRTGAAMFYFSAGDSCDEVAEDFVSEVDDLIREHGGGNRRIAVDKIMIHGLRALESAGFNVEDGEELTGKGALDQGARRNSSHEVRQPCLRIRCRANGGGGQAGSERGRDLGPCCTGKISAGAANGSRPGSWPRVQGRTPGSRNAGRACCKKMKFWRSIRTLSAATECASAFREPGGSVRSPLAPTWCTPCDTRPDHIAEHAAILKPGVSFRDLAFGGHVLDDKCQKLKYGAKMHGIGLCDEWPFILYPDQYKEGAFEYEVEAGMVFCVEALVGEEGGDFSIKLADQVLVTETGHENLTTYPLDKRLMGGES